MLIKRAPLGGQSASQSRREFGRYRLATPKPGITMKIKQLCCGSAFLTADFKPIPSRKTTTCVNYGKDLKAGLYRNSLMQQPLQHHLMIRLHSLLKNINPS